MTTLWLYRLYIVVRADLVTPARKTVVARMFSDNGSLETVVNEAKMLDNAVRLSVSGNLPAQAYGVSTPVQLSMRDAIRDLVVSLNTNFPGGGYVIVTANVTFNSLTKDELIFTNHPDGQPFVGQTVTARNILNFLNLKVIQDIV